MRRKLGAGLGAALALSLVGAAPRQDPVRPNVVVFLVDDLGWTDTGAYGSRFYETPNIDRLAAEGARFTRFYAASPVCSPTRASLMTGRHPARLHITDWIGGVSKGRLLPAEYVPALPVEEVTLGEAFAAAGYRTGYLGKWHLGRDGHMPRDQGFAWTIGVNRAGQPATYFHPYRSPNGAPTDVPDLERGAPGEYLTDRLTDEALGFLRESRDEPFLLVLSHYAVHTPLESKPEIEARHARRAAALPPLEVEAFTPEGADSLTRTRQDHPAYAAMVTSTDESLGRVLAELDVLGLARRTAVVLVSDNGGLSTLYRHRRDAPTSNRPLRAGKGWLYEGGIRIPFVLRLPGVVEAGRVIDTPAITDDLYPTLLDIAGIPPSPEPRLDGASLGPLLRGGPAPPATSTGTSPTTTARATRPRAPSCRATSSSSSGSRTGASSSTTSRPIPERPATSRGRGRPTRRGSGGGCTPGSKRSEPACRSPTPTGRAPVRAPRAPDPTQRRVETNISPRGAQNAAAARTSGDTHSSRAGRMPAGAGGARPWRS